MVKSANVGGHSTFLKTLDSRTVGIGGGSMVRLDEDGRIRDVGPRSAHIAGLEYLAFASSEELKGAKPSLISPMEGDAPDHLVMENPAGKRFAVTLTDAAIMAGMVRKGDYAFGNLENVQQCFSVLGQQYGQEPKTFAESILDKAVQRVDETVQTMLQDYQLDPQLLSLVGGGGGCTARCAVAEPQKRHPLYDCRKGGGDIRHRRRHGHAAGHRGPHRDRPLS